MQVQCTYCGKTFERRPDRAGRPFCSRECHVDSRRRYDPAMTETERRRARKLAYFQRYPERVRQTQRESHSRVRARLIAGYGGACVCCGESERLFLTIDHVNGGGREHAKRVGRSTVMWRQIITQGFPPEYQVLCMNCNFGKWRNGGECPHASARLVVLPRMTGRIRP